MVEKENFEKLILDYKKKISMKYNPEKIILFGSRARGDNLENSDVDIIIVSDKFESMKWPRRLAEVSELWSGVVEIEPLCYTVREFEEKKREIGIVSQAVKEGIRII